MSFAKGSPASRSWSLLRRFSGIGVPAAGKTHTISLKLNWIPYEFFIFFGDGDGQSRQRHLLACYQGLKSSQQIIRNWCSSCKAKNTKSDSVLDHWIESVFGTSLQLLNPGGWALTYLPAGLEQGSTGLVGVALQLQCTMRL